MLQDQRSKRACARTRLRAELSRSFFAIFLAKLDGAMDCRGFDGFGGYGLWLGLWLGWRLWWRACYLGVQVFGTPASTIPDRHPLPSSLPAALRLRSPIRIAYLRSEIVRHHLRIFFLGGATGARMSSYKSIT